jgi:hypothetical protein
MIKSSMGPERAALPYVTIASYIKLSGRTISKILESDEKCTL